jgi:hypothetical protein
MHRWYINAYCVFYDMCIISSLILCWEMFFTPRHYNIVALRWQYTWPASLASRCPLVLTIPW